MASSILEVSNMKSSPIIRYWYGPSGESPRAWNALMKKRVGALGSRATRAPVPARAMTYS